MTTSRANGTWIIDGRATGDVEAGDGLRRLDVRLVLEHDRRVEQPVDLRVDGGDDVRVAVADVGHGDAAAYR